MINSIRSMRYQVSYDERCAIVRRLADMSRRSFDGARLELFRVAVAELHRLDKDHLGNKPSAAFCKAFDAICARYFD